MKNLTEIAQAVDQFIQAERKMERQLDELEDSAVAAEQGSTPELTRILLLHADVIRGILEQSRRRWIRLSAVLGVIVLICLVLLVCSYAC